MIFVKKFTQLQYFAKKSINRDITRWKFAHIVWGHTFTLSNMPNIRQKCNTNLKLWTTYRKAANKLHQDVATRLKKLLANH